MRHRLITNTALRP
jgi:ATP-dependent DNA helicase PIF1